MSESPHAPASVARGFPVVGVVGGGQLARMMAAPAAALGIGLRVLATSYDDSAAQVIRDVRIGREDDLDALLDFARGCEVVTFDHEQVPPSLLNRLVAEGIAVRPGPNALVHAQDKVVMREALQEAGIPCPEWTVAQQPSQVAAFADRVGWPVVLKTSRGGYDGRGVWVVHSLAQADDVMTQTPLPANAQWLIEERVDFVQELAAQVARSPQGQAVAYPVVRTVQTDGMCTEVIAPAPGLSDAAATSAQQAALAVAGTLGVVGMLTVELFETADGRVLVNELAMRPHNSGPSTVLELMKHENGFDIC